MRRILEGSLLVIAASSISGPMACHRPHSAEPGARPRQRVIILCTGNSCRSQMAEAFWRKYGAAHWDVVSAGTHPKQEVYPLAVQVMAEKGIDIRSQRPKDAGLFVGQEFDLVVTVCDNAERECPSFRTARRHLHWPFDDPPKVVGGDAEKLRVCRRVRDEIEQQVRAFIDAAPD